MANRIHTIETKTIEKNCGALLAYYKKSAANEDVAKALFQEPEKIIIQIGLAKIPNVKNKTYFFDVPKSPIFDPEASEVCLVVKDDTKLDKYEQRDDLRKLFKEKCPFITEVLPLRVLKSECRTHEQKRILANSYDFFLADRDIFNVLPKHLGSQFIRNRKMPRKFNNLSPDLDDLKKINQC